MIAAFIRAYWRQILAVVILLAVAAWCWHRIVAYGDDRYAAGRNAVIAEEAIAAAQARLDADTHAAIAAQAGVDMHAGLAIALPKIEVTTHAAADRVQTIYLALPADSPACVRPVGVQAELDAALRAANSAANGHL